jgi:hypothetical protein
VVQTSEERKGNKGGKGGGGDGGKGALLANLRREEGALATQADALAAQIRNLEAQLRWGFAIACSASGLKRGLVGTGVLVVTCRCSSIPIR